MEQKHFGIRFVGPAESGDIWIVEGLGQSIEVNNKLQALALESILETVYNIADNSGYDRGFQRAYAMKDGSGLWAHNQPVPGIIISTPKE